MKKCENPGALLSCDSLLFIIHYRKDPPSHHPEHRESKSRSARLHGLYGQIQRQILGSEQPRHCTVKFLCHPMCIYPSACNQGCVTDCRHDPWLIVLHIHCDDLLSLLGRLPAKTRTVLYMHYYEEYSVKEIAELIGSTETAVTSQLWRGRARLRELLKNTDLMKRSGLCDELQ